MARVKASSDQTPMPVFGSGVILVPKMAPNGVLIRYPPAKGCPPSLVWHAAQCPTAERASPLATCSAEKLDGLGGSIGAIEGRHAKSNKPANMKQAVRIAIERRRIIIFFLWRVPEFPLELDSIGRMVTSETCRYRWVLPQLPAMKASR